MNSPSGNTSQRQPDVNSPLPATRPNPAPIAGRISRLKNDLKLLAISWGTSITLHATLIIISLVMVWSVVNRPEDKSHIIPIARLAADPDKPLPLAMANQDPAAVPVAAAAVSAAAPSPLSSAGPSAFGSAGASGQAEASATGSVQLLAPPATAASPLSAPKSAEAISPLAATFYGTGGNAKQIIYVVDASGSLIDTLDYVLAELRRSISELRPPQTFTILFFQGDQVLEPPPAGPKQTIPSVFKQVLAWIGPEAGNVRAKGGSSPLAALEKAFAYEPDLIFLLSDNITGRGPYQINQQRLLEQIGRMNRANVKINTLQFVYPDPLATHGTKGTLELIAAQSGGMYRFVPAADLKTPGSPGTPGSPASPGAATETP
ncbi:MAG: hypothetical protein IT443_12515 [Phycisphaeraceae bacterium]|nr:hypothetical protein [Phycisphaeraceae bacterium]